MEQHRQQAQPRPSERGATAVEFALVFPLLFGVFWAIISYALPFFMYQVMNYAVAETARDAVRYETVASQIGGPALVNSLPVEAQPTTLRGTLRNRLGVLPQSFRDKLSYRIAWASPEPCPATVACRTLTIALIYNGCSAGSSFCLVPSLNLFGVSIPSLPPYTAQTGIRLSVSP